MNARLAELNVARLDHYFGVWAIQEEPFRAAVDRVNRMDLRAHIAANQVEATSAVTGRGYPVTSGGVAVIQMTGPLMKFVGSLAAGTSTVWARRMIREAADDPAVSAIILSIDSPGGTVSGTGDLADDVAAASKKKPVYAYAEDLAASAAYWVASQAKKIYANRSALVGSIGTFAVIEDLSGMAAKEGIKVHVLRAGTFKGAGTPGTEVTTEQLGEWQRIVNELNDQFLRSVAKGRRRSLTTIRELADGRVHIGVEAEKLGLIDGVRSFDETLSEITGSSGRKVTATATTAKENAMENTDNALESMAMEAGTPPVVESKAPDPQPQVATIAELKSACPGSDAAFRESCLESGLTLAQAQERWIKHQAAELAKATAETKKPKVEPLGEGRASVSDGVGGGDSVADFSTRVATKIAAGMSRRAAVAAVAREDPTLHEAFLRQTNAKTGDVQRLIGERFAMVG